MYCTNCGFMLDDDARFCTNCGTKVEVPVGERDDAPSDEAAPPSDASASQDETIVLDSLSSTSEPLASQEEPLDMTHAFDPQVSSGSTATMPLVGSISPAPRSYDAVPPEEIIGKAAQPGKKLGTGAVIGIVVGAVAIVAIIAIVLFLFMFRGAAGYTVNFETAGGSTIEAERVHAGDSINSPVDPVRDGYSFGGWFSDSAFTTPVSFPLTPESDVTLYAKWIPLEGSTGSGAGATSETYSTNDQARAALNAYAGSLEQANDVVHDFATDSFNKKFNKGQSKVLDCMDDCNEAREKVYGLLASGTGTQWKVSTMALPTTFSEQRSMLEQASDTLITRLNAYSSALQVINNMGTNASSKEIETAIEGYLNDGHVAYESYKDLIAKVKKNL